MTRECVLQIKTSKTQPNVHILPYFIYVVSFQVCVCFCLTHVIAYSRQNRSSVGINNTDEACSRRNRNSLQNRFNSAKRSIYTNLQSKSKTTPTLLTKLVIKQTSSKSNEVKFFNQPVRITSGWDLVL